MKNISFLVVIILLTILNASFTFTRLSKSALADVNNLSLGQAGQIVTFAGGLSVPNSIWNASGNIGIGNTSPSYSLHIDTGKTLRIEGAAGVSSTNFFTFGGHGVFGIDAPGVGNGRFIVNDSGNVGIGTTVPAQKLSVAGTIESTSGGIKFPDGTTQTSAVSGGIPSGAVMFFNLSNCPSGWTEYTALRGKYAVGLPSGGTLNGGAGTALTNQENRAVGQHNHGISDPGHSHYVDMNISGGGNMGYQVAWNTVTNQYYTKGAYTGISINNAGSVAGTNAPYIQLLTCQKN